MSQSKNIHNMNLREVLDLQILQSSTNCYVYALSLSREEYPTPEILNFLIQLILREQNGDKWIEVIRRLSSKDYNMVFEVCLSNFYALRGIIQEAPIYATANHYRIMRQKLLETSLSLNNFIERQLFVFFQTYEMFVGIWLYTNEISQAQLSLQLISDSQCLMISMKQLLINSVKQQRITKIGIKIVKFLIKYLQLYGKLQKLFIKQLKLYKFRQRHQSLINLMEQIMPHIVRHSINTQLPLFIELLLSISSSNTFIRFFYLHNQELANFLISSLIICFQLKNNKATQAREVINAEHDMIYEQQSEDHPTLLCSLIRKLCEQIDGFMTSYINYIQNLVQHQQTSYSIILMYLCIIHNKFSQRLQLQQILKKIIQKHLKDIQQIFQNQNLIKIGNNFGNSIQICRLLRCMCIFQSYMGERYVIKCLWFCLDTLLFMKKDCLVSIQAHEILDQIIDLQEMARIIKDNIIQLSDRMLKVVSQNNIKQNVNIQFFRTIIKYLQKYNKMIIRNVVGWVEALCKIFIKQMQQLWIIGSKTSPYLLIVLQSLVKILEITKQTSLLEDGNSYFEVEVHLSPILKLLNYVQNVQFEQELLQILNSLLKISSTITGQLCSGILNIQKVFIKHQGSLSSIRKIIQSISSCQPLKNSVLFDYSQLIPFCISLFCNYLSKPLNLQYLVLYEDQFLKSLTTIQIFTQGFTDWIQNNTAQCNKLVKLLIEINEKMVNSLQNNELNIDNKYVLCLQQVIQNILCLEHLNCISTNLTNYSRYQHVIKLKNQMKWLNIQNSYSHKLLVICLCDLLVVQESTNQKLLDDIVDSFKLAKKNKFKPKINNYDSQVIKQYIEIPLNKISLKQLIEVSLRNAKQKHKIDDLEYIFYIRQCH